MHANLTFLDCPAYMDASGATRCGLPAEVEDRYTMSSTGGTLESARIRCPRGHWFNGPIESLTWDKEPAGELSQADRIRPAGAPRPVGHSPGTYPRTRN
jgi:hypothetical protein